MSDLTDYFNQRNKILIIKYGAIIIVAAVFAFLMLRGCQNSRTRLADATRMQQVNDSLKDRLRASEIAITNTRATYEARMAATRQEKTIAAHRADSAGKLLTATQARVKRLLNERVQVWEGPMVGVPTDCDTCFDLLKTLDLQVTGATENFNELNRILNYEIGIRDTALEAERRHSDTLRHFANGYRDLFERQVKANAPRNKIYFTLTALTDLTGFGYGGGFTLVTKTDKIWSLKTGVMNRQLFYQVDMGLKLSTRKK